MLVDIDKCIGCGNCVRACSRENQSQGLFPHLVERYQVGEDQQPQVDSPDGAIDGFPPNTRAGVKSFFVPKLCNQCKDSPCVQVCPVGATYVSPDGVVLSTRTTASAAAIASRPALTAAAICTGHQHRR